VGEIEEGDVEQILYGGESRYLARDELLAMLRHAGFVDVRSRALPNAVAYAKRLQQNGILSQLRQQDLVPSLCALAASAVALPGWDNAWVTCRKA
jgi:hypothetical protein